MSYTYVIYGKIGRVAVILQKEINIYGKQDY